MLGAWGWLQLAASPLIQGSCLSIRCSQAQHSAKLADLHKQHHPIWGQLLKTGHQNSRFANQVSPLFPPSAACNLPP